MLSAFFAAMAAIFAKIGREGIDLDYATLIDDDLTQIRHPVVCDQA